MLFSELDEIMIVKYIRIYVTFVGYMFVYIKSSVGLRGDFELGRIDIYGLYYF